jgi:hypothetical protein
MKKKKRSDDIILTRGRPGASPREESQSGEAGNAGEQRGNTDGSRPGGDAESRSSDDESDLEQHLGSGGAFEATEGGRDDED